MVRVPPLLPVRLVPPAARGGKPYPARQENKVIYTTLERGDIGAPAWTVDPDCAMVVDQQVAIEIAELEFMVRM